MEKWKDLIKREKCLLIVTCDLPLSVPVVHVCVHNFLIDVVEELNGLRIHCPSVLQAVGVRFNGTQNRACLRIYCLLLPCFPSGH